MKIKKFLAIGCAALMALGLAACSNTGSTTQETTTAQTADEGPVSLDFEDGNCGFVMPCTQIKAYDNSAVSVQEVNGSKVCYAANQGGSQMMLGIDASSILGDNLTKVASMKITIGTQYTDAFAASSGSVYAYYGEGCVQGTAGSWSIYMEDKNPSTFTYDLASAGITFTAGCKNYIVVSKETDNGTVTDEEGNTTSGDLYIDNVAFYDADGNVLEADTSATFDPVDGYVGSFSDDTASVGDVYEVDGNVDEWSACTWLVSVDGDDEANAAALEKLTSYAETGITVKVSYLFGSGYDYAMFAPINYDGWAKLAVSGNADEWTAMSSDEATEAGVDHFLQSDGYIVFPGGSSNTTTSVTFDIAAEEVQKIVDSWNNDGWGGLAAQVYGVNIYEVEIAPLGTDLSAGGSGASGDSYDVDCSGLDEWGACTWLCSVDGDDDANAATLEKLTSYAETGISVTVNYLFGSGYDYAMFAPINYNGWSKLAVSGNADEWTAMSSDEATEAGVDHFLQTDGYIVFPGGSANTSNSVTFELSAEEVQKVVDSWNSDGWGGLAAQIYGVNIYEVVINPLSAE